MWELKSKSNKVKAENLERARSAYSELLSRDDVGFFKTDILSACVEECKTIYRSLNTNFEQICVLGIGGSALGAQALVEALAPVSLETQEVLFFDNVDTKTFKRKLNGLRDPKRTLWVIISKSGGTIETLTQVDFISQYLQSKYSVNLAKSSVVITEFKDSLLHNWAKENNCPLLDVPKSIGGRYSALTTVGLFPALCLGINIDRLIEGSKRAMESVELREEILAQLDMSYQRKEIVTYFFNYCDDLRNSGLWIQQLWSESLGKSRTSSGGSAPAFSVPIGIRGSTDQHSVLQQIVEGNFKKFVCFLRVKDSENYGETLNRTMFQSSLLEGNDLGDLISAEADGTQGAIAEADVSFMSLECKSLSEESMGFLFMLMELSVASLGLMYHIDPFNQPGVEQSKINTRTILR